MNLFVNAAAINIVAIADTNMLQQTSYAVGIPNLVQNNSRILNALPKHVLDVEDQQGGR